MQYNGYFSARFFCISQPFPSLCKDVAVDLVYIANTFLSIVFITNLWYILFIKWANEFSLSVSYASVKV